jgi:general stress protein CsbA
VSPNETYALIADTRNSAIRKIILNTTEVSTLAGSSYGFSNGIGTTAQFNYPQAVIISPSGEFALVADSNFMIRHILLSISAVTTFAGNGFQGISDGIGTNVFLGYPSGLTISTNGIVALMTDSYNNQHIIRQIIISTAAVSIVAGCTIFDVTKGTNASFSSPSTLSISSNGSFALLADSGNHAIRSLIVSTSAVSVLAGGATSGYLDGIGTNARFYYPTSVSISPNDSFALVTDTYNHRIRKIILSTAEVSTLAGGPVGSLTGIGTNSRFDSPQSVAISSNGEFALVTDLKNSMIRYINLATSEVTTLAGRSGQGLENGISTNSRFGSPSGLAISANGFFALVTDSYNNQYTIRQIILSTAAVSVVAGRTVFDVAIGTNARFFAPLKRT